MSISSLRSLLKLVKPEGLRASFLITGSSLQVLAKVLDCVGVLMTTVIGIGAAFLAVLLQTNFGSSLVPIPFVHLSL